IPDYTSADFIIRSKTIEELNDLKTRVYNCFEAAGKATGCTEANGTKDPKITPKTKYFDVNSNIPLGERYEKHLRKFGIDFKAKNRTRSGNHTIGFTDICKTDLAHDATFIASKGIALTALDFLIDDEFVKQVKDAFNGGPSWKDSM
ncbi:unnamed protein product, partial [Rhizophagus irregularis]